MKKANKSIEVKRGMAFIALAAVMLLSAAANTAAQTGGRGAVPNQLAGIWSIGDSWIFEITTDRGFLINGSYLEYEIMPSSNLGAGSGTMRVGYDNIELGSFNYRISGGTMTVSNGTDAFESWGRIDLTYSGPGGASSARQSAASLDGVWAMNSSSGEVVITVSGTSGVYSTLNPGNAVGLDAKNKGLITVGGQYWRNLRSTGDRTWSGQWLAVRSESSAPNVATRTSWENMTLTMSADGRTLTEDDGTIWIKRQ